MSTDAGIFDDPRLTAMGLLAETFTGMQAKIMPALTEAGLSDDRLRRAAQAGPVTGQEAGMTDLATQTALSTSGVHPGGGTAGEPRARPQGNLPRLTGGERTPR